MGQSIKHHIGTILLNGKFMTQRALDFALEEQQHTKELLGQVLVRMGILSVDDIKAPLLIQEHLGNLEDAVRLAAGERQLLGDLLVQSGHISAAQLDDAIAEQRLSGERLGEVFTRLGILTEPQLKALLDFQKNQTPTTTSPLRLGELLVTTGHLTRKDLETALQKQRQTNKKLGEILVDEGYVSTDHISYGMRMQKMLLNSVLAIILSASMSAPACASSVSLAWESDTDPAVVGYKVHYAADSSSQPFQDFEPIDVRDQATASIDNLDPARSYFFAVTSYDATGAESGYSNIVTIPESVAPATSIRYPVNHETVSGTVSVAVDANDNAGVSRVELYVNGMLQAAETTAPCVFSWDTSEVIPGTYSLMTKAYDAAGNIGHSEMETVTVVGVDTQAPTVALTTPANNTTVAGTVTISASAHDNVGVSYVEFYENGVLLFAANTVPYSFNWNTTTVANGKHLIIAKAYDAAGNIAQSSNIPITVNNVPLDISAPAISTFSLPATSKTLTIAIRSLKATDNIRVTGYLLTENSSAPSASAVGWSPSAPTSFTFSTPGNRTVYAWAKDAAGNVSSAKSASVIITLPDLTAPTVSSFTLPATSQSLKVAVTSLEAADNLAVTGYQITESATKPAVASSAWKPSPPATFTFTTPGNRTAYAWVKDAAGNISSAQSSSVIITLPDLTFPMVKSFTMPTTSQSLTVAITGFVATDNNGVTGYLITESSKKPSAAATDWNSSIPKSYTFSGTGRKTAYAWVRDAAGNVSSAKSNTVIITKMP